MADYVCPLTGLFCRDLGIHCRDLCDLELSRRYRALWALLRTTPGSMSPQGDMGVIFLCSFIQGRCNALQRTATAIHCNIPQHSATFRNTLQHSAAHCNTLQNTSKHLNALQHTAAHWNTMTHRMQHNATQCNTLRVDTSPHGSHLISAP